MEEALDLSSDSILNNNNVFMYVCMYVCIYVCMYVCVCVCNKCSNSAKEHNYVTNITITKISVLITKYICALHKVIEIHCH